MRHDRDQAGIDLIFDLLQHLLSFSWEFRLQQRIHQLHLRWLALAHNLHGYVVNGLQCLKRVLITPFLGFLRIRLNHRNQHVIDLFFMLTRSLDRILAADNLLDQLHFLLHGSARGLIDFVAHILDLFAQAGQFVLAGHIRSSIDTAGELLEEGVIQQTAAHSDQGLARFNIRCG